MTSSNTVTSDALDAICRTRLPGPTPKPSTAVSTRLVMPRWGTSTPLGRPVEPDVKIT
jgi:hypothetical protein